MASQPSEVKTEVSSPAQANGHQGEQNQTPGSMRGRKRGSRGSRGHMLNRGPHNEQRSNEPNVAEGTGDNNMNRGGPRPTRFNGPQRPENRENDRINERLMLINGPTTDLPTLDTTEKKFSGRSRLYIGNLTNDVTEDEIKELFTPFGETSELFVNKEKNFAFIRMDYHVNAEKAKRELDGRMRKGRSLKVRFAPNGTTIKVRNLTPWTTNELLYTAFSVFGEIERCVIVVDDRGKSTGEGIVEFARKPAAQAAIRRCGDECFFLTSSLRPVIVEAYDIVDDIDGYSEKSLGTKKPQDYYKARDIGPRFAVPGSFEHEYGTRWKQLSEIYKQKKEALKREQAMEEEKLEAQMEYARYEHETEILREQLRAREMDRERQKREWEMKERAVEEARQRGEEQLRRMQEDIAMRMHHQEEDLRRRQEENNLFLKAHQLNDMLDQQERYDSNAIGGGNENMQGPPPDPKTFMDSYDQRGRGGGGGGGGGYDMEMNTDMRGGPDMRGNTDIRGGGNDMRGPGDMRGRNVGGGGWGGNQGRRDDYQNKRRRY